MSVEPFPPPSFLLNTLGDRHARVGAHTETLVRSPDGRHLASYLASRVMLLDADTLDVVRWYETAPLASLRSLAFTADGKHLLASGWVDTLFVIDLTTGARTTVALGRRHGITLAASPTDPDLAFTGGFERHARLWSLRDGTLVGEVPCWEGPHALPDTDYLHDASFSPDGRLLLTVSYNGADLWDVATREHRHRLADREFCVAGAAFSPDGAAVYLTSNTGRLARAVVATGALTELATIASAGRSIHRPQVTSDGERLLASGEDAHLHVIRLSDGETVASVRLVGGPVCSALLNDGVRAVVLDRAGLLLRVSTADGAVLDPVSEQHVGYCNAITWVHHDRSVFVHSNHRDLTRYSLDGVAQRLQHGKVVGPFSLDGRYVFAETPERTVYEVESWTPVPSASLTAGGWHRGILPGGRSVVAIDRMVIFEHDGVTLAVPSMARSGAMLLAPDGSRVFVVHRGTRVVVIDVKTRAVVQERALPRSNAMVALDARHIAVGLSGARVSIVDVEGDDKGRDIRITKEKEVGALSVLASKRDGRLLAAGFSTGQVALVEVASGAVRAWFEAAWGGRTSVAFSHDGTRLATCGDDQRVRVWDVAAAMGAGGAPTAAKKKKRGSG